MKKNGAIFKFLQSKLYSNVPFRRDKGFTLLETIIFLAIVMTVVGAIYGLQNFVLKQQSYVINSYLSVENTNQATEILIKQIRNAKNGDNGAYLLDTCNDQELIFFSNADFDDEIERVRYFLDGQEFKKGIINPTEYPISYPPEDEFVTTIAEDIVNFDEPIFYYYNSDWPVDTVNNPLSLESRRLRTRLIKVHILANSNPDELSTDYEISSYVQIRVLKDNI